MLDRALSGFVPHILDEKPELLSALDGFTLYPNCVSFANHTYLGASSMLGGYEYTPEEINKDDSLSVLTRVLDAQLVQPLIFSNAGYSVTFTDAPYETAQMKKRFLEHPEIQYDNLNEKYAATWLKQHPDVEVISISDLLKNKFIRFSFFKMAPPVFRLFVYDHGLYLSTDQLRAVVKSIRPNTMLSIIGFYAELDFLPELTTTTEDSTNTFTFLQNPLPHDPLFMQAPDYIPATVVTNKGHGEFSDIPYYHSNIATFTLLGDFLKHLQENGVYNNTRIIVVSDHGGNVLTDRSDFILPTGEYRQSYCPLLMVKDFNERHDFTSDYTFMTNADVPLLTTKDLIPHAVNPFTGKLLESKKSGKLAIATIPAFILHPGNKYNIKDDQWLYVHDDVFKPENWETVK